MRRRTTIDLDHELVTAAAQVLGTKRIVETVHTALQEVVARKRRAWLVRQPLPDLTAEAIAEMRKPRSF